MIRERTLSAARTEDGRSLLERSAISSTMLSSLISARRKRPNAGIK
jgi:hypothetical protein